MPAAFVPRTGERRRRAVSAGATPVLSPALLLLDETGGDAVAERLPDTHDVTRLGADDLPPGQDSLRPTTFGLLFAKQAATLEAVADAYDWRCLMRLDDDAPILGPNPHDDALTWFERWEDVGMLGAYLHPGGRSSRAGGPTTPSSSSGGAMR